MKSYDVVSREIEVDVFLSSRVLDVVRKVVRQYDGAEISNCVIVRSYAWRVGFSADEEDRALELLVTRSEWNKSEE